MTSYDLNENSGQVDPPTGAIQRRGVLAGLLGGGVAVGGAALTAFSSATPANAAPPFAEKSSMPVNVKDHGALGDGEADDAQAVQAAISVAASRGGGVVFFPAGKYAVSQAVTVTSDNIVLMGEGNASQIVHWDSTSHTLVALQGPAGRSTGYIRRCALVDLAIGDHVLGDPMEDGPTDGDSAVVLSKTIEFRVDNCTVEQHGGPGLTLIDAYIGSISNSIVRLCTDGIVAVGCTNALRFTGNRIQNNSGVGIRAPLDEVSPNEFTPQFKGIYIAGNDIEGNGSYAILFENAHYAGITIVGNYFEANHAPRFGSLEEGPSIFKPAMPGNNACTGIAIIGNQFAIRPDDLSEPAPTVLLEQGSQFSLIGNATITYGSSDPEVRFRDTFEFGDAVTASFIGPVHDGALRATGDVELEPESGVVLAAPNGTRYRVVVSDDGTLTSEPL